MKSFQERLFKDFDVEKVEKDGKIRNVYVYKGDYASWNLEEEGRKRYRRLYAASGILICLLYLWKALQKTPMNASHIVGGITMLSFVALLLLVMGVWQFVFAGEEMYLRDCRQMIPLIMGGSGLYALLQAAGTVAGIVFLVREGFSAAGLLVVLATAVSGFLSGCIFLAQKKLTYQVRKGSDTR